MAGNRQETGAVQFALVQQYPHLKTHMEEVGEDLGRTVRWVYLASVALWVVALSVLAFATQIQGPVGL